MQVQVPRRVEPWGCGTVCAASARNEASKAAHATRRETKPSSKMVKSEDARAAASAAVLQALQDRATVLQHLCQMAMLTRRVRTVAMPKKMGSHLPRLALVPQPDAAMKRPHPERPIFELGLSPDVLRTHRTNLAVLVASLRMATLRVVEAVGAWQECVPKVLLYRRRASGGPGVRPASYLQNRTNVLHGLLFDEVQQFVPMPLSSDPLLLRWFRPGDGALFRAEALHTTAQLRRMHRADTVLRSEVRFHDLAAISHRPAGVGKPLFAELELLLYGEHGFWHAAKAEFEAREELHAVESVVVMLQAAFRGSRTRKPVAPAPNASAPPTAPQTTDASLAVFDGDD